MTGIRSVRRGVLRWVVGVAVAAVALSTLSAVPAVAATGIVSGTLTRAVEGGPPVPVSGGSVAFYPTTAMGLMSGTGIVTNGVFSANVPPGKYRVGFYGSDGSEANRQWIWLGNTPFKSQSQILEVTAAGVTGVNAELPLGMTASGTISYTDDVAPEDHRGAVWTFLLDETTRTFEPASYATAASDGTFVLRGLVPGRYLVRFGDWSSPPVLDTRYYDNAEFVSESSPLVIEQGVDVTGITATLGANGLVMFRLGGADRFATAAAISAAGFPAGASTVFIANGMNYPDALGGGPAAAKLGAPLLLVTPTSIPTATKEELDLLDPDDIVVLGGTGSVSDTVVAQLSGYGTVHRLGGQDRYETSRRVVQEFWEESGSRTVYIADGRNFPDALAAGPAAGNEFSPVLLVNGAASGVDASTADLLASLGATRLILAGGTGSISATVEQGLTDLPGIEEVYREGGQTRYETATALVYQSFRFADTVFLAAGGNFPDALAGGAIAGQLPAPVFLVQQNCVPSEVIEQIVELRPGTIILLGGSGILGPGVEQLVSC